MPASTNEQPETAPMSAVQDSSCDEDSTSDGEDVNMRDFVANIEHVARTLNDRRKVHRRDSKFYRREVKNLRNKNRQLVNENEKLYHDSQKIQSLRRGIDELKQRRQKDQDQMRNQRLKHNQLRREISELKRHQSKFEHLVCSICLEKYIGSVTTCGHGFCSECLTRVFRTQETSLHTDEPIPLGEAKCPSCREELDEDHDVIMLYL